MPTQPSVRFRVDFGRQCSVGIGKIELLEAIADSGSLSQAARKMRMSYRRAWSLLADLNLHFEEKVAVASIGGRGGGGVVLTPFGKRLILGYRQLEARLQPLAAGYFREVGERLTAPHAAALALKPMMASIKRKASAVKRS